MQIIGNLSVQGNLLNLEGNYTLMIKTIQFVKERDMCGKYLIMTQISTNQLEDSL